MKKLLPQIDLNKAMFSFKNMFFALSLVLASANISAQTEITVSSVADLATAATNSDQIITMEKGIYQMEDYLTPLVISNSVPDANGRHSMILFSGSNNTFDLTDVTIEVNTELLNAYGSRCIEFYVTGSNVNIKGLTVNDIGESAPSSPGMQSFTVAGENVTVEDVTLNINGSYPYGYGDLLGKGDDNLVTLRKHSGLLVEGLNINIIRCSIYSEAFGHLFFIQGGRNVLFQDCHAEAVTRTTDAMLAETSGPAFDNDFAAVYGNYDGEKVITPGYTKSLSEGGFRTYGSGGVDGNITGDISFINCIAKNTRIGFATEVGGKILIENCEAIGCEAGYNVQNVTIKNSRGDAVNGPLLYLSGDDSEVELELIPTLPTTILHAIATIAGSNNKVTFTKWGDNTRTEEHKIILGAIRPSGANPFSPLGTGTTLGITLDNSTDMPVEILPTTTGSTINTTGRVINNSTGNIINADGGIEDQNFDDGVYTYNILGTSPNECQVTGFVSGQEVASAKIPEHAENNSVTYSVVAVGENAFLSNTTITDVTLPSTVTSIESTAFSNSTNLTTINLENIVTYGDNSFSNCAALALAPLDLTKAVSTGNYTFINCASITSVIVPGTLSLGVGALRGTGITSFIIPNEWTIMPDQMIRDCKSMTSINIPSTITTMGVAAFRGCTGITEMQVNWTASEDIADATVGNLFNGLTLSGVNLFVPTGTETLYEAANVWTDFNISGGLLSTNEVEKELGFSIYPNPANAVLYIKNSQVRDAVITVYDLKGRALLHKNVNNTEVRIDISNLATGLYLIKVRSGANQFTKRIVKK
ncbi:leucine-rich repeat domain-containing protein [Formosa undariae]|uniref:Leucine-rich repeat domain-containing protein n=1 Tax=Formosa undariae TaxID=1325436 RepID=A0ABV5EZP2_9FLAO